MTQTIPNLSYFYTEEYFSKAPVSFKEFPPIYIRGMPNCDDLKKFKNSETPVSLVVFTIQPNRNPDRNIVQTMTHCMIKMAILNRLKGSNILDLDRRLFFIDLVGIQPNDYDQAIFETKAYLENGSASKDFAIVHCKKVASGDQYNPYHLYRVYYDAFYPK